MKKILVLLALTAGVLLALTSPAPADIAKHPERSEGQGGLHVAPGGECGGATPCYATLQQALDQAAEGDTIKLAAGVYTDVHGRPAPGNYEGPAVITQVAYISRTVTVRGGFTPTDWGTADPEANPTTLDAAGQGRGLVVVGQVSPTLEGLRIAGGDATGLGGGPIGMNAGGGVYVLSATVTISDCQVLSNAAHFGGGLFLNHSAGTLGDNDLTANAASYNGGGLYLYRSSATLTGNTVTSSLYGGGLYLDMSEAMLSHNFIAANRGYQGGGLCLWDSAAVLNENTIVTNTSIYGGGMSLWGSQATLKGNIVLSNSANWGGGMYLEPITVTLDGNIIDANVAEKGAGVYLAGHSATLANNVIADNQAIVSGSGLYILASSPHLLHNTIARNHGGDGSGIYVTNFGASLSTAWLTNTILVSHTVGITVAAGSTATLEATLWGGAGSAGLPNWGGEGTVITGTHNYWGDVDFVDPDTGDYHLGPGSAAIDRGVPTTLISDIDGAYRPQGLAPDLGADEAPGVALEITKDGPAWAWPGEPITYTIAVESRGQVPATGTLLVTDGVPVGAHLIGRPAQEVLTWTVDLGTVGLPWQASFVVTAAQTITNDDYGVRAGGLAAKGGRVVVTYILGRRVYLPLVVRELGR